MCLQLRLAPRINGLANTAQLLLGGFRQRLGLLRREDEIHLHQMVRDVPLEPCQCSRGVGERRVELGLLRGERVQPPHALVGPLVGDGQKLEIGADLSLQIRLVARTGALVLLDETANPPGKDLAPALRQVVAEPVLVQRQLETCHLVEATKGPKERRVGISLCIRPEKLRDLPGTEHIGDPVFVAEGRVPAPVDLGPPDPGRAQARAGVGGLEKNNATQVRRSPRVVVKSARVLSIAAGLRVATRAEEGQILRLVLQRPAVERLAGERGAERRTAGMGCRKE